MVNVPDSTLFAVSGVVAPSVTMTFAWTVLPTYALGIIHAKLFVVDATFVKSIFSTSAPVTVLVII